MRLPGVCHSLQSTATGAEQDRDRTNNPSLRERLAVALATYVPVLYVGSVKADNAASLFAMPDIDGGLIGGASLKLDEFLAIGHV